MLISVDFDTRRQLLWNTVAELDACDVRLPILCPVTVRHYCGCASQVDISPKVTEGQSQQQSHYKYEHDA